ncbi:hypothetical protein OOK58_42955 [Streptomyces sp. NBC_01728]|uniref:hypothetical protein n=1 Tax=unclassified Streptomyces TaxID=2593676 RepID=UPI00224FBDCA|nr:MULTISPECIES: hypothetical protein [unclassified Streptomyces]MCX4458672.1 hypothetical protein [Streptomyces sp. NBC_01719]MCX4498029.1 hypothetical protein [Streptomyces sp. NBC_01728]
MSGCCGQGPVIVTGAAATPRVDVEAVLLCDVLPDGTVAGLALVEPVYDTVSGDRVGTRIVDPTTGAAYTPTGTLGVCGATDQCARQISTRTRCDDTTGGGVADATYVEVWALDPCNGDAPTLLGAFLDGDFAQPYTPVAPVDCPEASADTPVVLGTVCYDAGADETRTAAILKCAACGDPTVTYLDVETGATVTAPTVVPCAAAAADHATQLLCDVAADGTSTPFLRRFTTDGTGTTFVDTTLDGSTAYTPTGTVGVCMPVSDCASPTEPTATIGLCLPDGTPIAVTVVRDCDGVVTAEGWINLQTGAYSAGAPPVGTVACGSSQSVQVSGTFCDVLADGTVAGLVLIEYSYAADGTIDSVRLVDATTGATYTPTGTVTTCPAGVEQSEQDVVQLCDTAADGTVTAFVRDYRRDETGAITGHSDYLLDGTSYVPTGTVGNCQPDPQPERDLAVLCDTAADGTVTAFVRDYQRDETGAITAHSDYTLDGTPYVPTGTVGLCEPEGCQNCEALLLCDDGADDAALITGTASSGTLSNGVTWQATGPSPFAPGRNNADGSWWGLGTFPNPVTPNTTWTFNRPVDVEFSVVIRHAGGTGPTDNTALIPAGAEVVSLPDGYLYDPATRILSADPTVTDCAVLAAPSQAAGARFRLTNPVSSFSLRYLGARVANCGQFGNWYFGAITVTSSGQFLRTICRDCTGAVVSTTETTLDGVTPYTLLGAPGLCADTGAEAAVADVEPLLLCDTDTVGTVTQFLRHYVYDGSTGALDSFRDTGLDGSTTYVPSTGGTVGQCQPAACEFTPVCVRPSGRVEFLSNPAGDTSGVDADWTWGQSLAGPWFPTYRVGVYPGWTTTDPGTAEGTAHWIAPHPDSQLANTGQPGEGPAITAGTPDWYGRASFQLPSFADPATIRISATVLNADQLAVDWRLNGGAWQPVNRNHTQPPYTLAPTAVPGAQAGLNEIVVHVQETVFPTGAAGILLHVIAEYDVDASAYLQWTQVVCTDGAVYFLDDLGARQDALPDGSTIVPCPGSGEAGVDVESYPLCVIDDASGTVLQTIRREVVYDATGAVTGSRYVDAVTGDPVALPGGTHIAVCPSTEACTKQILERCGCDDTDGDGIGDVTYTELWAVDPCGGDAPVLLGAFLDGDLTQPYTPVAPVECTAAEVLPGPLSTGVRAVTGTTVQNLASAFPGVQSVSLTVLAGTVDVTMSDGTSVPIPAGVTMTWSVAQDSDTALAAAVFAGATAASQYLLNWTYR